jgi:predicted transcriptional regulator
MREQKPRKVPVGIRLSSDTKARAEAFARADRRTLSNVLQWAVKEYLEHHPLLNVPPTNKEF